MEGRQAARLAAVDLCRSVDGTDRDFDQAGQPGPGVIRAEALGFNNEVIGVLKSRTMHIDRADPSGAQRTVRNDPRVTRLGRILRWLSFDELPQLINVIRGDMSLVGPRPRAVPMKAGDRLYG